MKTCSWTVGIVLLMLNLCTELRWGIGFTHLPLYHKCVCRLPPWCNRDIRSSKMLRSVDWYWVTDVSEQNAGPERSSNPRSPQYPLSVTLSPHGNFFIFSEKNPITSAGSHAHSLVKLRTAVTPPPLPGISVVLSPSFRRKICIRHCHSKWSHCYLF